MSNFDDLSFLYFDGLTKDSKSKFDELALDAATLYQMFYVAKV